MADEPKNGGYRGSTLWGLVIVGLLGGATGGGAGSAIFARPDPYTGTDAKALRLELLAEIARVEREANWARHDLEDGIRDDMPPESTRKRIEGIETVLFENHGYRPPTYRWSGRIVD